MQSHSSQIQQIDFKTVLAQWRCGENGVPCVQRYIFPHTFRAYLWNTGHWVPCVSRSEGVGENGVPCVQRYALKGWEKMECPVFKDMLWRGGGVLANNISFLSAFQAQHSKPHPTTLKNYLSPNLPAYDRMLSGSILKQNALCHPRTTHNPSLRIWGMHSIYRAYPIHLCSWMCEVLQN